MECNVTAIKDNFYSLDGLSDGDLCASHSEKLCVKCKGATKQDKPATRTSSEIVYVGKDYRPNTNLSLHRHKWTPGELNEINGLSTTALHRTWSVEFNSWHNMKYNRCGEDGGYVLHPDFSAFRSFLLIMGPKSDDSFTLDRVDFNNPEYSPENCRWASKALQTANRASTRYYTDDTGLRLSAREWEKRTGVSRQTMAARVKGGWSVDDAVHTPLSAPRKSTQLIPGARENSERCATLWTNTLREKYDLKFIALRPQDLKRLKEIRQFFREGGIEEPLEAMRCVLEHWSKFVYCVERHTYYEFQHPRVPNIDFLHKWITPAG